MGGTDRSTSLRSDERSTSPKSVFHIPGMRVPLHRNTHYVEDPIFVRVHQVCEGILEALLVELNKVEAALFEADYATAERHVLMASRFMKSFERTVAQLGEMSQLDYAPLRVALRDASGIQSARAQARKEVVQDHFWLFRQQLKRRGLDCFVVLANHVELAREYRLLQAFKTLGKTINESMSHHAHLVTNTLGSTVIGTVGFRILSLGEIAAMPLFRDLAKALDRLTLCCARPSLERGDGALHDAPKPSVRPGGSRVPPGKGWPPAGTECCVVYG